MFVCPFIPDTYTIVLKVLNIGISLEKPEQLVNDRPQVQFLGGKIHQSRKQNHDVTSCLIMDFFKTNKKAELHLM